MGLGHNLTSAQDAPTDYVPTADDLSLERGIQAAYEATVKAATHEAQRAAYRHLSELVALRSPEMVAFMERQRGIG
jgi:hypothetical protein